jgi:hypothetical protein
MRKGCGLFLISITAAACSVWSGPQPSPQPFSIAIAPATAAVKAGEEVYIKIHMTNKSDHNVDCSSVYVNGVDRRYYYAVRDNNGNSVKRPIENLELYPGSIQLCTLKPGESTTGGSRVSWLNDVSRPGKYVIQVSRGVSSNEKDGVVKSNKITLTVDP